MSMSSLESVLVIIIIVISFSAMHRNHFCVHEVFVAVNLSAPISGIAKGRIIYTLIEQSFDCNIPYVGKFWSGKKLANLANRGSSPIFYSPIISFRMLNTTLFITQCFVY